MDEHRTIQRHRVFKAGTIAFGGSTISCMVRNLANTGAMLEVISQASIPHQFTLVLSADKVESALPCRVAQGQTNRRDLLLGRLGYWLDGKPKPKARP